MNKDYISLVFTGNPTDALGDCISNMPEDEVRILANRSFCYDSNDEVIRFTTSTTVGGDFSMANPSVFEIKDNFFRHGINTPRFYKAPKHKNIFRFFKGDEKLAIKTNRTARGLGKAIVDLPTLKKLSQIVASSYPKYDTEEESDIARSIDFYKCLGLVDKNNNIINVGSARTKRECRQLYDAYKINNFIFEDLIKIKKEYRLYYVYGAKVEDYLVTERFNYGLNSDPEKTKAKQIKNSGIPRELLNRIKKLGESVNALTLSFDIYVDKDGYWGCFEYDVAYASQALTKKGNKVLTQQLINALKLRRDEKLARNKKHKY